MKQTNYYKDLYHQINELAEDIDNKDYEVHEMLCDALTIDSHPEVFLRKYFERCPEIYNLAKHIQKHIAMNNDFVDNIEVIKEACIKLEDIAAFTIHTENGNIKIEGWESFKGYMIICEIPELKRYLNISPKVYEDTDIFAEDRIKGNRYNRFQIMDLDVDE